jgi:NTE family protein
LKLRLPHQGATHAAAETETNPPCLGLVLGGGSVRGAAHLGVVSVLEREGIRPDLIAGTSVGAIVGAGVAAGVPAAEMHEYFKAARWRHLATPSWSSRLSLFDTHPLGALLERIVAAQTFDQLALPFAAVATDILAGTSFVFTEGPLREALVASSAIPGLFEPVRREGRLLVDGAISDNLPVDAARDLGATLVVAVDIMPLPPRTYEPKDVRDMLLLSGNVMVRSAARRAERADLVITPDVARASYWDFSEAQALYEAGAQSAEKALPDLRRILGQKGPPWLS